ncbi:hypothetical protein D3C80_2210010 [compost metagenome]
MGNGARHINPPAARLEDGGATAEFTFRINLRREGGAVEGRGERQCINLDHCDLLLALAQVSMAQKARRESK